MGLFLYSEFLNDRNEPFRIEIHDTDFSGTETEFHVGADGFVLEYQGDTEKPFQPIVGSTVTIELQIESGSQGLNNATTIEGFLDDLLTSDEDRFTVVIRDEHSATGGVFWVGILQPEQINTADESFPRRIELTASDDLANLKGIDYNNDGSAYTGTDTILTYVLNCLGKTRTTQHWGASVKYLVNNSYILGQETTGGTPIENYKLLNEDFYTTESGIVEYISAYEMLKQICESFMFSIYQARGVWVMVPRMYVTLTGTYSAKYFDKSGAVVAGSGAYNTVKLIDQTPSSRVQRLTGGEYGHLNAYKSVRRNYTFNGNIPLINEDLVTADLNTTTFQNSVFILPSGGELVCQLQLNLTLDADATVTGNERAIRYLVELEINAGAYYLNRPAALVGGDSVFILSDGDLIDVFTFQLGAAEWNATASNRLQWFTPALDYEAGDNSPTMFGFNIPGIPADATGLSVKVHLTPYKADGTTAGAFTTAVLNDTTLNFGSVNFFAGDDVAYSGDEIIYSATADNKARDILELDDGIIGDQISTTATRGAIRGNDNTYTAADEWSTISAPTDYDLILRTLVGEHLAYHNVPREVLRFTLYDDVLYFDDVFQFDSRRFAVMNMRFIANLGEYETELIEMSRNATGITAATGPKKPIRRPKVIIDKPQEVETLIGLGSVNKRVTLKLGLDYETNPKTKFNSKSAASGKATDFGTLLRSADNMTGEVEFVLPEADGSNGDVLTTNGSGVMSFTTPSGGGGAVLNYFGAASVDSQTVERFIPMTGGNVSDFGTNIDPMKAVIPLASTLGTVSVRVGAGSVDAVVKIYKNSSVEFTSDSTTWGSAGDIKTFTVNSGSYAAGDTFSLSIDQSTSVDMNYVVASVTFNLAAAPAGTAISNVVEDTTPQLGGDLDVNGHEIISASNGDIELNPNGTGDVKLGNFIFDVDQSVGVGQDNNVLTYDNSTGKISLEASSGGGGGGNSYVQMNGGANNTNNGVNRYIPLGGNYFDTGGILVYTEGLCPFDGVVESVTVRTANASGSTTTKLWVNGSEVNTSTNTISAATPLTINFGDSVSVGDKIAVSMNTANSAGDTHVTVLIKKS